MNLRTDNAGISVCMRRARARMRTRGKIKRRREVSQMSKLVFLVVAVVSVATICHGQISNPHQKCNKMQQKRTQQDEKQCQKKKRERRKEEKRNNKYIPLFPTPTGLLVTAVPPKIYKKLSQLLDPQGHYSNLTPAQKTLAVYVLNTKHTVYPL